MDESTFCAHLKYVIKIVRNYGCSYSSNTSDFEVHRYIENGHHFRNSHTISVCKLSVRVLILKVINDAFIEALR